MRKERTNRRAAASVAVLHPGQMGVSLANALATSGNQVYWVSTERSNATIGRACEAGLTDAKSLQQVCKLADVIFSVCPPESALELALQVVACGYNGTFVDCNAIAPSTTLEIASELEAAGSRFADAAIVGPSPERMGTTRLYIAGKQATSVASLFSGSLFDTVVLGDEPGSASALKMSYAAWVKGSVALLMNAYALARQQGVADALLDEWSLSPPNLAQQLRDAAQVNAPKAWCFAGEMNEIGHAFESADLPRAWFEAAEATYQRLNKFKNRQRPELDDVIDSLHHSD